MAARRAYSNNYRQHGGHDDDEDSASSYGSRSTARTTSSSTSSLRTQLASIADQFERQRSTETRLLNSRISTLMAEKREMENTRDEAKDELETEKAKVAERDETIAELTAQVTKFKSDAKAASKTMVGLRFIIAELVKEWPKLPVYDMDGFTASMRVALEASLRAKEQEFGVDVSDEGEDDVDDEEEDSDQENEEDASQEEDNESDDDDEQLRKEELAQAETEDDEETIDGDSADEESKTLSSKKKKKKKKKTKDGKTRRGGKKKNKKNKKDGIVDEGEPTDVQKLDGSWEDVELVTAEACMPPTPPPLKVVTVTPPVPGDTLTKISSADKGELEESKMKKKKKKKKKMVAAPMVELPSMPTISYHEAAPMPSDLSSMLPEGLMTREEFQELVGCGGITRKQLNRLEALLEPNDLANQQQAGRQVIEDMVDECLGSGLNSCCGSSGSLRICRLLLKHGASPSYSGQQFDASPMHRAIQHGHDNLVALLLAQKVSVNATDPILGRTPLHFAAQHNRPEVAKSLLQKGATVDAVDSAGETAADIATRLKWKRVLTTLNDPSILFWNYANRANKLYKCMEYEGAITSYERVLNLLDDVKPPPSAQTRATLHYNLARAAANLGQHLKSLPNCQAALDLVSDYQSALEQRAKSNMCLYNYKLAIDDFDSLIDDAEDDSSNLTSWMNMKKEAQTKLDRTHFEILGLDRNCTDAEIKKAYRKECLAWHPDKHVSTNEAKHRAHIMFQKVNEANEVLTNPAKRRSYEYTTRTYKASTTRSGTYTRGSTSRWPYGNTYSSSNDDSENEDM